MAIIKKSTHKSGEGVEKRKPPYTTGANINWYSRWWKTVRTFLKKLKEFPRDPASPLLGIYPDKTLTRKDTCTPMFTEALFTAAETWKQPQRPPTEDWIKKTWCTHTLSHEKKERSAVCSNVDRPRADQTEVRRSGKDNVIWHHLWNLKYDIYVQNK